MMFVFESSIGGARSKATGRRGCVRRGILLLASLSLIVSLAVRIFAIAR